MKQNIIMIVILVSLFFFGLLIYDFSDELTSDIANNSWYAVMDGELNKINLTNHKFSFVKDETGDKISIYDACQTYRYNRNINVIRLNCNIKANKIHLSNISTESITLSLNGEEVAFFSEKSEAWNANFRDNNNLTIEEFNELMDFDFNKYTEISGSNIDSLVKSNDPRYIAFVNNNQTLKNALNLEGLRNYANNSLAPVVIVRIDYLRNDDLTVLRKLNKEIPSKVEDFNTDKIPIYKAEGKKLNFIFEIDINTFVEAEAYTNI